MLTTLCIAANPTSKSQQEKFQKIKNRPQEHKFKDGHPPPPSGDWGVAGKMPII